MRRLFLLLLLFSVPAFGAVTREVTEFNASDTANAPSDTDTCIHTREAMWWDYESGDYFFCDPATDQWALVPAGTAAAAGTTYDVQGRGSGGALDADSTLTHDTSTGMTEAKILNKVKFAHKYSTSGDGTNGTPWVVTTASIGLAADERVHFAKGEYDVTQLDWRELNDVTITGDGEATIINCTGTEECIWWSPLGGKEVQFVMSDIRLNQEGTLSSGVAALRIGWNECDGGDNDGDPCGAQSTCDPGGGTCQGLRSALVELENVTVRGDGAAITNGVAVSITNNNAAYISNLNIDAESGGVGSWAIGLQLSKDEATNRGNVTVIGGMIYKAWVGVEVGNGAAIVNNFQFYGVKLVKHGDGFFLPTTIGLDVYSGAKLVTVSGVHFENYGRAIVNRGTRGLFSITGSIFSGFSGGVCDGDITVFCDEVVDSACSAFSPTTCDLVTYIDQPAIQFLDSSSNLTATGNLFSNACDDLAGGCGYALELPDLPLCDDITFMGNEKRSTKSTLNDLGASTQNRINHVFLSAVVPETSWMRLWGDNTAPTLQLISEDVDSSGMLRFEEGDFTNKWDLYSASEAFKLAANDVVMMQVSQGGDVIIKDDLTLQAFDDDCGTLTMGYTLPVLVENNCSGDLDLEAKGDTNIVLDNDDDDAGTNKLRIWDGPATEVASLNATALQIDGVLDADGTGTHTLAGDVTIGDGTAADQTLTFDIDSDQTIAWDESDSEFAVSAPVKITGDLETTTGAVVGDDLTVSGNAITFGTGTAADQTFTFNDDDTDGTITFTETGDLFVISEDVEFEERILYDDADAAGTRVAVAEFSTTVGSWTKYAMGGVEKEQFENESALIIPFRDELIFAVEGPAGCVGSQDPWMCCSSAGEYLTISATDIEGDCTGDGAPYFCCTALDAWDCEGHCGRSSTTQTVYFGEGGKAVVNMVGNGNINASGNGIYNGKVSGDGGVQPGTATSPPTCDASTDGMLFNDSSGALCRCANGTGWQIVFDEGSGNCT